MTARHIVQQLMLVSVQEQFVMALAVVGEVALADSYCKQFGLDPGGLPLQGEALARSCQERDAMFLALSIPVENVQFVNSTEASSSSSSLPLYEMNV